MREMMDDLHAQLSTHAVPASGGGGGGSKKKKKKGASGAAPGALTTGEEVAAATLRLLASVARFHRYVFPRPPLNRYLFAARAANRLPTLVARKYFFPR